MNDLALHIEYLLLSHDCVIVPGLGAFLAHRNVACVDSDADVMMPPSRSLGFNADLTLNDGLLAGSIARRERISIDAANARVEAAVSSFLHQLSRSGCLSIGELGELSVAADSGALEFSPNASSLPVSLPSLGLYPVQLVRLKADDAIRDDHHIVEIPVRRRSAVRRALLAAASVIGVLLCIAFVFNSRVNFDDCRQQLASMNIDFSEKLNTLTSVFSKQNNTIAESVSEPEDSIPLSREIILSISMPPQEKPVVAVSRPDRYLIIVGSFPSASAAGRFIGGDDSLGVIEMDGNYRVYAASASNYAEAKAKSEIVSERFAAVWICHR